MNSKTNTHDDTIDLKELLFSLIAQWKIIVICTILSSILALIYLRVTTPIYSTNAMLQVEDGKGAGAAALLGSLSSALPSGMGGKSATEAEIQILKSRLILGETIQKLRLDIQIRNNENTLFNRLIEQNKDQIVYKNNLISFKTPQKQWMLGAFDIPKEYVDQPLLLEFKDNNQFTLSFKDRVVYTGTLNQKHSTAPHTDGWNVQIFTDTNFNNQSFTLQKFSLPNAIEALLANYSVSETGKLSGIIGLTYEGNDPKHITRVLNNILDSYQTQNIERKTLEKKQTLGFLDQQLPELRKQLEEAEIRFNNFRQKNNTIDVTQEAELMLKENVELAKLKIQLEQQQAELSAKYTNDHPLMSAINAQLSEINKKTSEMTQKIKSLPETQRQYLQLYRDVKINTELYTALLNSYQQLKIAQAGEVGDVRIIDHAIEPVEKIKPKSLMTLILSIFLGGFVGVLISLMRNLMQNGVKDTAQIEEEFNLPVYATVPRSPFQKNRLDKLKKQKIIPILAEKNSDDIAIESLRSIRTALHFTFKNAKNNVMLITGPAPSIGKSFVSTNLAVILAQTGKRVLLIDADLRRGYLHQYFNVENKNGLTGYLVDENGLEQVIKSTNIPGLDFMNRGRSPTNPAELLSSDRFKQLIDDLQDRYDHVLIDSPPVLAVTDSVVISQFSAVNLIVARFNQTAMKELEITVNRFEQAGTKVTGFIMNDVQKTLGGSYAYNYAYTAQKEDLD